MILSEFIKKLQELEAQDYGDASVQAEVTMRDDGESWTEWELAGQPYVAKDTPERNKVRISA